MSDDVIPHDPNLSAADLRIGDLLLFREPRVDPTSQTQKIIDWTGSRYTHAAVYIGGEQVAHATSRGVEVSLLKIMLRHYGYAAVSRQPYLWGPRQVERLTNFVKMTVEQCPGYDQEGLESFPERKRSHEDTIENRLTAHVIEKSYEPLPPKPSRRFTCCGFIAAAFWKAGCLDEGTAIAYSYDAISPADLASDGGMWGDFYGYIVRSGHLVPADDQFYGQYETLRAHREDRRAASGLINSTPN